jgi:hypothetical protein
MKRVANGEASPDELAQFQKIIDQITIEHKRVGILQGPSADRLLVDGRTVKYFADEVRTILDLVLRSNPNEKSSTLRPPERSDPLIVALVKTALDQLRTREMVKRIADGKPTFSDATDLKAILDKLHKELKSTQSAPPTPTQPSPAVANGLVNGHAASPTTGPPPQAPAQQALRSKGPPPAPKPDIQGVVFEFAGGNGDRYLFPKYSILEYLQGGQHVVASFLLVLKGSTSEYGCDPNLDYYERFTVRLYANTGRHLENLARVVAPQEEVIRYMNDIMDSATRAEYILLAMRLPRGNPMANGDGLDGTPEEQARTNGSGTPKPEVMPQKQVAQNPGILWTARTRSPSPSRGPRKLGGPGRSSKDVVGEKIYGIPPLKPRYTPREPSPPVFSLRKGLGNGYSDSDAERYTRMAQSLAAKEPEST